MKSAVISLAAFAFVFLGAPVHAQATPNPTPVTEEASVQADLDVAEVSATEAQAVQAEDARVAAAAAPEIDPDAMNPAPPDASLVSVYREFGEEPGLVALMDLFMTKLVADPRTRRFFENADQAMVKKHLVEQFCVILGGPCGYTGRDMRTAHKGFDIDRAQFNALVEDLQLAMNERGISFRAQNKLLAKLAPMHRDIEHR